MAVTEESHLRPFFISKELLDTLNSMCWFLVDAFWMLGFKNPAIGFSVPTVLSGFCLLYIEKRLPVFFINLALNSWIWMNLLWMSSDILFWPEASFYAKIFFASGLVFVGGAICTTQNLGDTFSHFRRFRFFKW